MSAVTTSERTPVSKGGRLFHSTGCREEWAALRSTGIGGSDIGTVIGVNPHKRAVQLFAEKLGLFRDDCQNFRMFMGNYMEAHVARLWQHWEGDEESLIRNFSAGRIVRRCSEAPQTLRLKRWPFLVGNIDRVIEGRRKGVLECKTINGYYAAQWSLQVPPAYLYQIQHYMLLTGFRFAEVALLVDGNQFRVMQFDADPAMQEIIVERGREFWQRVEAARPTALEYLKEENRPCPDRHKLEALAEKIAQHEPGPEGTPAYEEFLRKRFRDPVGARLGTDEELRMARQYRALGERKTAAAEAQQEVKNEILHRLGNTEILDFGDAGRVTWKTNEKGVRTLRVSVREE